jgi:hypothetical protein
LHGSPDEAAITGDFVHRDDSTFFRVLPFSSGKSFVGNLLERETPASTELHHNQALRDFLQPVE